MSKVEMRQELLAKSSVVGNMEFEVGELQKMQKNQAEDIVTITVTCGHFLTIVCCS